MDSHSCFHCGCHWVVLYAHDLPSHPAPGGVSCLEKMHAGPGACTWRSVGVRAASQPCFWPRAVTTGSGRLRAGSGHEGMVGGGKKPFPQHNPFAGRPESMADGVLAIFIQFFAVVSPSRFLCFCFLAVNEIIRNDLSSTNVHS